MNKKEVKKHIEFYIENFVKENGFIQIKKNLGDTDFLFYREIPSGEERFVININSYGGTHKMWFAYNKRINVINEILLTLNKSSILENPIDSESATFYFNRNGLNNLRGLPFLKDVKCEEDIRLNIDEIINFSNEIAFPLYNQFEDLRYIDRVINGDDFWVDDWLKKYGINQFKYTRLIIAKLVGNPKFDEIVEKNFELLQKAADEEGYGYIVNRTDPNAPFQVLLNILKDVKPIY